jgi:hypothetical protein
MADTDLVVPRFFVHTVPDEVQSKEKGRPVFKDIECVEIRLAANKQSLPVFPAHEVWEWGEVDGIHQEITYAMRFPEQYRKFKAGEAQAVAGTPLEELTFLTQAKRYELKALNVYTVEALASLDSQPLKNLGQEGRDLKNQAVAYLAKATDGAATSKMASELTRLRERVAELEQGAVTPETGSVSPFFDMDAEAIKVWIGDNTGSKPRGQPSHETLVRMADEINADLKKKTEQAAA